MIGEEPLRVAHFIGGPIDGDSGPVAPEAMTFHVPQIELSQGYPVRVLPTVHSYERIGGSDEFLYIGKHYQA
jgi:hypothetical protein